MQKSKIKDELTRKERMNQIRKLIKKGEKQGYGLLEIKFCHYQIVGITLRKDNLWGNTSQEWYDK